MSQPQNDELVFTSFRNVLGIEMAKSFFFLFFFFCLFGLPRKISGVRKDIFGRGKQGRMNKPLNKQADTHLKLFQT